MATNEMKHITDAEWEVMRVIWTLNEATSKQIIDVLKEKMSWKPATTKTLIGRLVKKEIIDTKPMGKQFLYTAAINETEAVKTTTSQIFGHICARRIGQTIANMISEAVLSKDDIQLLESVLADKKKEAVDLIECDCVPGQCHCKHH